MNLSVFAKTALMWIGRIIGLIDTPIGKEFTRTILGKVLGDKAPHYLAKLAELEQGVGAHTTVWSSVEEAAKKGLPVTLTVDGTLYLYKYKKLWDKHIKNPMDKAAIKLQATPPTQDELAVVAIANAIITEEHLDDDNE